MRLINADELVKIFHREGNSDAWGGEFIRRTIEEQPTIEAVPLEDYRSMEQTVHKLTQAIAEAEPVKHGRWLRTDAYPHRIYCSECYATFIRNDEFPHLEDIPHNYCPNCGAKMDDPEAEP